MPDNDKINKALFKLLQPIARLCLRLGLGYREYCELSKAAFVEVAARDYGVHGRPTNVSRIAAMTGLTRKEVSRLRRKVENGGAMRTERASPLREVIAAWQSEAEFCDRTGKPRLLPLEGKRGSFHSLVRRFAGDIPDGAMRKELVRIGAARPVGDLLELTPRDTADVEASRDEAAEVLGIAHARLAAIVREVRP